MNAEQKVDFRPNPIVLRCPACHHALRPFDVMCRGCGFPSYFRPVVCRFGHMNTMVAPLCQACDTPISSLN